MKESVFKAYDIRGTVGKDFLLESVSDLGYAIATFFKKEYPNVKTIVVGRDGRIHSKQIKNDIITSLIDSGFSVVDIGLVPSPLVYFALATKPYDAGIIVTASHNKKDDNGIKINVGKDALSSQDIQKIKEYYIQKKVLFFEGKGIIQEIDIVREYIAFLKKSFANLIGSDIPFVVDCGNGASGVVISQLIKEMQFKHAKILCAAIDGNFPNHDANPTKLENMCDVFNELKTEKYNVGIGIDGDGDRMAAMTESGKLLSGDTLLTIFSEYILEKSQDVTIVCNVLSSDILMDYLKKQGATISMVPVGNPIMRSEIKKEHAQLGGETSGHFFFADHYFGFDDGIYAMLRLLELLEQSKKTLDTLVEKLPCRYTSLEFRVHCTEDEKKNILHDAKIYFQKQNAALLLIDGVRAQFKEGWILLRPSNTEHLLSIRFESKTKDGYALLKKHLLCMLPSHIAACIKDS